MPLLSDNICVSMTPQWRPRRYRLYLNDHSWAFEGFVVDCISQNLPMVVAILAAFWLLWGK